MFGPGEQVFQLPQGLDEISGMVESRTQPGIFWVHNDSGDAPRVYAISRSGGLLGTYVLEGASAVDWEDMATGPAPGGAYYLYLADIGDNQGKRQNVRIYRVLEPHVDPSPPAISRTLTGVGSFTYVYPDGPRDAESFLVDPLSGDFYIVSKRDEQNRLYRSTSPSLERTNTWEYVTNFNFTQSTGGEISPDGLQVLIRRYSIFRPNAEIAASYWHRPDAATPLTELLKQPPLPVALAVEAQGEAIAFAADNAGFYTTTERAGSSNPAPVTYYPFTGR